MGIFLRCSFCSGLKSAELSTRITACQNQISKRSDNLLNGPLPRQLTSGPKGPNCRRPLWAFQCKNKNKTSLTTSLAWRSHGTGLNEATKLQLHMAHQYMCVAVAVGKLHAYEFVFAASRKAIQTTRDQNLWLETMAAAQSPAGALL